jgi:hypothetical protein
MHPLNATNNNTGPTSKRPSTAPSKNRITSRHKGQRKILQTIFFLLFFNHLSIRHKLRHYGLHMWKNHETTLFSVLTLSYAVLVNNHSHNLLELTQPWFFLSFIIVKVTNAYNFIIEIIDSKRNHITSPYSVCNMSCKLQASSTLKPIYFHFLR